MRITLNGGELDCSLDTERTVGEVLVSLDEWLEAQGLIITALSVDGQDYSGSVESLRDRPVDGVGELALSAADSGSFKATALSRLLDFLSKASTASPPAPAASSLLTEGRALLDSHSGLLDAEEVSVLEAALAALDSSATESSKAAGRAAEFLSSRLAELEKPLEALEAVIGRYRSSRQAISSIPVLMQTSRDREAMEELSRFTGLFSLAIRLIPLVRAAGVELPPAYEGKDAETFHRELNQGLTELTGAFERRDTVLIGDLCEYEILPRLDSLFEGLASVLQSGGKR